MTKFGSIPTFILGAATLLVLAGCGGSAGAAPTGKAVHHPTPTSTVALPTVVVNTSTPLPTATATATVAAPTPTSTAVPATATSQPVAAAPQVVSAAVTPGTVTAGATVHAQVQVRGRARRVELYLSSGPGGAGPVTMTLDPLGGGAWASSGTAPSSAGTYHYSVGLYDLTGKRTVADDDAWNITVTGSTQPSGPQPLPADVPLAPPFSYGNPQPAVFSAEGHSVSGSEVVSNSRPEVGAAVVAQWYETHFPRAGWTVDQSTVPGAGATSFSIVATTGGNRVCVASYSGGVVQVFYGSFSG
jgi:hypothetical protein